MTVKTPLVFGITETVEYQCFVVTIPRKNSRANYVQVMEEQRPFIEWTCERNQQGYPLPILSETGTGLAWSIAFPTYSEALEFYLRFG